MDFKCWELYKYITKILEESFYNIYLADENCWIQLDSVTFDWTTIEDEFELPTVDIEVRYRNKQSVDVTTFNTSIFLEKSYEFNVGYITRILDLYGE